MTRHWCRALLVVSGLGAVLVAEVPAWSVPQPASPVVGGVRLNSSEAALVGFVNDARRAAGLVPVVVAPGTTEVARRWSRQLAAASTLSHNPALARQLTASGSPRWTRVTENVGHASACDPRQLFDAYMGSPGHRKNILDARVRYVGVGSVVRADPASSCEAVWNTMDFVDSYTPAYGPSRM